MAVIKDLGFGKHGIAGGMFVYFHQTKRKVMDWIISGPGFKPAHASWSRGRQIFPLSMPNFLPTVQTLPG